jgi:hypothetical protein
MEFEFCDCKKYGSRKHPGILREPLIRDWRSTEKVVEFEDASIIPPPPPGLQIILALLILTKYQTGNLEVVAQSAQRVFARGSDPAISFAVSDKQTANK